MPSAGRVDHVSSTAPLPLVGETQGPTMSPRPAQFDANAQGSSEAAPEFDRRPLPAYSGPGISCDCDPEGDGLDRILNAFADTNEGVDVARPDLATSGKYREAPGREPGTHRTDCVIARTAPRVLVSTTPD